MYGKQERTKTLFGGYKSTDTQGTRRRRMIWFMSGLGNKTLINIFTNCIKYDIISMLHKLNIRVRGIFVFIGILYLFLAIIIFELGKSASSTK